MITLIAAVDNDGGIGHNNQIPWHVSEDFKHFKSTTECSTIVMGRKTWESIGKPLSNRKNIVISKQNLELPKDVIHYKDMVSVSINHNHENIFIIGGQEIYEWWINLADRLIISKIPQSYKCDKAFPPIDFKVWKTNKIQTIHSKKNNFDFDIYEYVR